VADLEPYTIQRIRNAGEQMHSALSLLFGSIPSQAHRPGGLHRQFGIQKDASGFLYSAYIAKNPLVVVSHLPGTTSLAAICSRLESSGRVPNSVIEKLKGGAENLDRAVKDIAGERAVLDEMISFWIPEVRKDVERRASMSLYRSARAIQGNSVRHAASVRLYIPGESSGDLKIAHGAAVFGMRRLRLKVDFRVSYGHHWNQEGDVFRFQDAHELDVTEFSANQVMRVEPMYGAPCPDRWFVPMGDPVKGKPLVRDVAMARTGLIKNSRGSLESGELFVETLLGTPTEYVVADYLIHKDIEIKASPEAYLLDYMDLSRMPRETPRDRLPVVPVAIELQKLSIELLQRDAGEFAKYGEFVSRLASELGKEVSEFTLYRVVLEYPPYASCLRVYL
jgi:hypothetical protein